MPENTLNQRDAKVIQWLGEAHAKEAELEADLTAHIALTQKSSYKKRLQRHLTETRDHKRKVASRIKKLGGTPGLSLPGVPQAVGEAAGKAVAAVKGQVGTARAAITSQNETHLRNAQEELREEHVEIAIYSRIETLANEVGDRETSQLVRGIRRDEERMAKFLDAELGRLVKAVVRDEIPRTQRGGATRRRRRRASTSRSRSGTRSSGRAASSRSRGRAASSRGGSSRSSRSRTSRSSRSGTSRRSSSSSRARGSSSASGS